MVALVLEHFLEQLCESKDDVADASWMLWPESWHFAFYAQLSRIKENTLLPRSCHISRVRPRRPSQFHELLRTSEQGITALSGAFGVQEQALHPCKEQRLC